MVSGRWAGSWTGAAALTAALVLGCGDHRAQSTADADAVADAADDAAQPDADAGPQDADAADDADADASPPTELRLQAGEHTALIAEPDGNLRLEQDGEVRLRLPLSAFELGVVPALADDLAYDPYYFEPEAKLGALFQPPDGLEWVDPERGLPSLTSAGTLEIALTWPGGAQGSVRFTAPAEGRFAAEWKGPETGGLPVFFRLRPRASADEGFYGLGHYLDAVEHRGRVRAMQIEPNPIESGINEANVPVPLLIGTKGWGLFVATRRPGVFAVATEADDLVKATFGLGPAWADGLQFHLFAADHPMDILRSYYQVTGFPKLPAPWGVGPVLWRDEVAGQEAVIDDLDTIRSLDLATTGYWIDRPYASGESTFDFDPQRYDDPAQMIAQAHARGFRMALWHVPYIDPKDPDAAALRAEAEDKGYFPAEATTAIGPWGGPIDYTNPEAVSWWQQHLRAYTDMGIEGFKLDYAQEIQVGAFGVRLPWQFWDGQDERTMHVWSQYLYHQMYAEVLPEDGGYLLCRTGTWGDQTHGLVIWPGDIDSNFAHQGDEVTASNGETYTAVGGLPGAVVAGSTLSASGFPFFASDTGGYRHAPPDQETYTRWFEHTALSPAMQVGTNSNDLPWEFGPNAEFIPELVALYSTYARLHLRLFPYLWTYAKRIAEDGRPIQRALGFAFPELGVHPSDVYMLGDFLFVAPVTAAGVTSREVMLPPGVWVDWWTGERHPGGQLTTLDAPLERIPFLVLAGTPIPLLRPTIDTLSPVEDTEAIDSLATRHGLLYARLAPGAVGGFVLDDDTHLLQSVEDGQVRVSWTPGSDWVEGVVYEVFGLSSAPGEVLDDTGASFEAAATVEALDALDTGTAWSDEHGGTLLIKLTPQRSSARFTLP
ncbi:MAG: glycoside hydrolase family 31 protein [Deltaproteobacteria bacterium]|nr:glycoside hydrolase family 31 protein [Deltaproteobacteria bacterium]